MARTTHPITRVDLPVAGASDYFNLRKNRRRGRRPTYERPEIVGLADAPLVEAGQSKIETGYAAS